MNIFICSNVSMYELCEVSYKKNKHLDRIGITKGVEIFFFFSVRPPTYTKLKYGSNSFIKCSRQNRIKLLDGLPYITYSFNLLCKHVTIIIYEIRIITLF